MESDMRVKQAKKIAVIATAALAFGCTSAVAAETTSPSPKPTLSAEQKAAREQFKAAMVKYKEAREAAQTAFKSAVAAAKAAKDANLAAATTPEAKAAAKKAFQDAMAAAKTARDAALAKVGAKPTAPAKPAN